MSADGTVAAPRWQRWSLGVARAVGEPCLAAAFVCLVLVAWTDESRGRGNLLGGAFLLVGGGSLLVRSARRWPWLQRAGVGAMSLGGLGGFAAALG